MWLLLAFLSAALLGFYDVFKKKSLHDNAVLPVLFLNTLFCSLVFVPFIIASLGWPEALEGTLFHVPRVGYEGHLLILLKAFIVLGSWFFGLNTWQWAGVTLAIVSFFLLSRSGRKEGIDFRHNRWIACIVLAAVLGAVSGLYDKFLTSRLEPMAVQAWYNVYQVFIMCPVLLLLWWPRRAAQPFRWDWCIVGISVFLSAADFVYFYALSLDGSLVSVVSMVRRGSVIVSFLFGAMVFQEKNLRGKAVDLALVLLGMLCLYMGSR